MKVPDGVTIIRAGTAPSKHPPTGTLWEGTCDKCGCVVRYEAEHVLIIRHGDDTVSLVGCCPMRECRSAVTVAQVPPGPAVP